LNFGYVKRSDKRIDAKIDSESSGFEVQFGRLEFAMPSIDGSSRLSRIALNFRM